MLTNYVEWKYIEGYAGLYEVSTDGQVRSVERMGKTRLIKSKLRKTHVGKEGYMRVTLSKNCKPQTISLHRLIAIAFIPNPEGLRDVNHIDGNKLNNSIENLEWVTHAENIKHAYDNGLNRKARGSASPQAKLDEDKVFEIKKRLEQGETIVSLANYFNMSKTQIHAIKSNKKWNHIQLGGKAI